MIELIIFLVLYFIAFVWYIITNLGNKYPTKRDIIIGNMFYPMLIFIMLIGLPFQLLFNFHGTIQWYKQEFKIHFNKLGK